MRRSGRTPRAARCPSSRHCSPARPRAAWYRVCPLPEILSERGSFGDGRLGSGPLGGDHGDTPLPGRASRRQGHHRGHRAMVDPAAAAGGGRVEARSGPGRDGRAGGAGLGRPAGHHPVERRLRPGQAASHHDHEPRAE